MDSVEVEDVFAEVTEESSLLAHADHAEASSSREREHEKVYDRFTPAQKRLILFIVSWAGLIPLFVSGSFVPSIPQVARELHSSGSVINLAVSLSLVSGGLSNLFWATYSSHYGRRPIYTFSLPIFCLGSFGVATAQSVPALIIWRVIQNSGSSSGLSVGTGVIGDIYKLEERGTAMGLFFAASLSGTAFAPIAGGLAAHYASWRLMQMVLLFTGIFVFLLMFFYLPETSHPGVTGADKLAQEEGEGARRKWVWLNPLRSIALLRAPNFALVTVAGTFVLLTDFVLLTPLSYTIGGKYGITNEAIIGAFFVATGIGNILGAPLAGRISDKIIIKWRKERGGIWVPEDRLRATLIPAAVLVPCSVLFIGLTIQFVDGKLGIALNLVWLFMNGLGVDLVLGPLTAYLVDVMRSRSAELAAAHRGTRILVTGILVSFVLPMINSIGVAATNAIFAGLAWIAALSLWLTVRYGEEFRAWVDVGYTTVEEA